MKQLISFILLLSATVTFAQELSARELFYDVTVTNLSKSQTFSPSVVVAHSDRYSMFTPGQPASDALAVLAEDGNGVPLKDEALLSSAVSDVQISGGLLAPGESTTVRVKATRKRDRITVVGMLVTTNDAFFAVRNQPLATSPYSIGSRNLVTTVMADVYDSGTEANTEDCDHIPIPCGNFGVRATEGAEGFIHIHNGFHGIGDLDKATYDWRNPGAMVQITPIR